MVAVKVVMKVEHSDATTAEPMEPPMDAMTVGTMADVSDARTEMLTVEKSAAWKADLMASLLAEQSACLKADLKDDETDTRKVGLRAGESDDTSGKLLVGR